MLTKGEPVSDKKIADPRRVQKKLLKIKIVKEGEPFLPQQSFLEGRRSLPSLSCPSPSFEGLDFPTRLQQINEMTDHLSVTLRLS